jgi:hypothetical protein
MGLKSVAANIMVLLLSLPALATPPMTPQNNEFFEQQVRPLLAQRCYACHAGLQPKGGLSLESRAGWQRGSMSGAVVVPGDPDGSRLIKAVRHAPGVPSMPPGTQLSRHEVATLTRWVKLGAPDPRDGAKSPSAASSGHHWAFLPLRHVVPPVVKSSAWVRTPIDRFILAKLEAKGLHPAPPADRRTLIRRATYDLLGLPPPPAEVAAFCADTSPRAYEKLIDRLLADPRYGERWGRHWLDVAHYGDTHGYDKDKRRDHAWPYRDYVIAAFNHDKPYGRFIKEQIAGDVLYPQDPQGVIAVGFLAAGPWDFVGEVELAEGTVEKEKTRLLDRDDLVSTVMSTFDSMTVHCARCHDHKFDPIPQRDYYRLQAVFAGVERGDRPYYDPQLQAAKSVLQLRRADLTDKRNALLARIAAIGSPELTRLAADQATARAQLAALPLPTHGSGSPTNGYHSGIASKPDETKWVQIDLGRSLPIQEIHLIPARPTDFPDTPGFGFPARFQVAVSDDPTFRTATVILDRTDADYPNPGDNQVVVSPSNKENPQITQINTDFKTSEHPHTQIPNTEHRTPDPLTAHYVRVTATRLWKRTNDYVFALAEMQVLSNGANVARSAKVTSLDSIEQGRWGVNNLIDNYDSRNPLPDLSDPAVAAQVRRRAEVQHHIDDLERAHQAEVEAQTPLEVRHEREQVDRALAAVETQLAALPPPNLVYSVLPHAPRPVCVLARGDVEQRGEPVGPGALSCVPGLNAAFGPADRTDEGAGRAALAEWIAAPQNMLTWRSIVNRVWHYHFTRGIVETPNDFGRNGARPTHPELLDWLAIWFQEHGQSIKQLHRLIMLSSVYRQSSQFDATCVRADSENHLLWRMNRRRLEAEEIRDSVLAVSGKLDPTSGGPGYERFRFKDDHSPVYDYGNTAKLTDPATFRRTVYEFVTRSVPDPFLESLDGADPNANTPVRNTTLTALQALTLRNDPFMIQQAGFFADRLRHANADPGRQIETAYLLLYGRRPSAAERAGLLDYTAAHGLANTCRLLFNTNEFVFID